MADDDIRIFILLAQHDCCTLCTVEMAGSMEAIASYIVISVPLIGNGIHECFLRHGLMPCSVEDDGLGNGRHCFPGCFNAHDIGRHV